MSKVSANLVMAQGVLEGGYATAEFKYKIPEVLLSVLSKSGTFFQNYESLRTSKDRTLQANYIQRAVRALVTGDRSNTHTNSRLDSGTVNMTFTTYKDGMRNSIKQGLNSVFNSPVQMAHELQNIYINFANGLDSATTTYLFNQKSGVNDSIARGTFNATTDVFEIASADLDDAINISDIATKVNEFDIQTSTVYLDSTMYSNVRRQAAQGIQNQTNLSFQFQGITFVHAIGLDAQATDLGYTRGFWLVVPDGTVGAFPWIPQENRIGFSDANVGYGSLINPIDQLTYATHSVSSNVTDANGNTDPQDYTTDIEVSIDIAFAIAPSSETDRTSINAYGIVA